MGSSAAVGSYPQNTSTTSSAGYIGAGAQGVGAVAGALSEYRAGQYNSKVDEYNARVADLQGQDALNRAGFAINRLRAKTRSLVGAQRAGFAAQNVQVDADTAGAVVDQTQSMSEDDVRQLAVNARLQAWGFQASANDSRAKAALARSEGDNRAMATLLGGVAGAADSANKVSIARRGS